MKSMGHWASVKNLQFLHGRLMLLSVSNAKVTNTQRKPIVQFGTTIPLDAKAGTIVASRTHNVVPIASYLVL